MQQFLLVFRKEPRFRYEAVELIREDSLSTIQNPEERPFAADFTAAHVPREPAFPFSKPVELVVGEFMLGRDPD